MSLPAPAAASWRRRPAPPDEAGGPTEFAVIQGRQIPRMLSDYLDGVAPPVPSLELELETGQGNRALQRFDMETRDRDVGLLDGRDPVADMLPTGGCQALRSERRGFSGSTDISRSMQATLEMEQDYFWSIQQRHPPSICRREGEKVVGDGRAILRVQSEVINGQQTTRVLAGAGGAGGEASVLVRVIAVPRDSGPRTL